MTVCHSIQNVKYAITYMNGVSLRTPADIGALIRARRRELGLDQAELAEMAGVSRLWINQVEGGKPGAGLGLVLRTLAALGIEISEGAPIPGADVPDVITPDINAIIENARTVSRK
jgi:HTH-type transcriptional regulator / antitoxin HipB